ncbi:hypothetical protein GCM10025734_33740 [Kitasatospora paranensis]
MPGRNEGVDAHRLGVRHEDFPHERLSRPDMVHAPPQSSPDVPNGGGRRPEQLLADPVHIRLLRGGATPGGDSPLVCPTCATPIGGGTEQLLAALAASESRFRAAFADAGVGMALIGTDDRIIEANPALAAMLGRSADELGDLHVHELIDSEDAPQHLFKELADGAHDRLILERRLRHRTGRSVWSKVTVSLVRDSAGNPLSTLAVVEDVTERRMLGDRLAYQSLHDPLTRLPNRTLFFERLEAAFLGAGGMADAGRTGAAATADDRSDRDRQDGPSDGTERLDGSARGAGSAGGPDSGVGSESGGDRGRGGDRIGLCYLDLDSFAAINETLGHHVGDQLLVAVAARLEKDFGQDEDRLVARLGGDEFAVLVTGSQGADQLTSLAARLVESLERPFEAGGHHLVVTASVGVVERPVGGTSPTDLLKDADSTLYWSKADGRARWTLYDPARGAHQLTTQRLATALRPALERGEFAVEYQPLVGLADGLVHGAEALVRWRHPGTERSPRTASSRLRRSPARSFLSGSGSWRSRAVRPASGWRNSPTWRCSSASTWRPDRSGTPTSWPTSPMSSTARGCRPACSSWRSPRAPSWARADGRCRPCRPSLTWVSGSPSTTSAPATRTSPISRGCPSTCSNSTGASSRASATRPDRRPRDR